MPGSYREDQRYFNLRRDPDNVDPNFMELPTEEFAHMRSPAVAGVPRPQASALETASAPHPSDRPEKHAGIPEERPTDLIIPKGDPNVRLPSVPRAFALNTADMFGGAGKEGKEVSPTRKFMGTLAALGPSIATGVAAGVATGSPEIGFAAGGATALAQHGSLAFIRKAREDDDSAVREERERRRKVRESAREAGENRAFNAAREELVQECTTDDERLLTQRLVTRVLPPMGAKEMLRAAPRLVAGTFEKAYSAAAGRLASGRKDLGRARGRVMKTELDPITRNIATSLTLDAAGKRAERKLHSAVSAHQVEAVSGVVREALQEVIKKREGILNQTIYELTEKHRNLKNTLVGDSSMPTQKKARIIENSRKDIENRRAQMKQDYGIDHLKRALGHGDLVGIARAMELAPKGKGKVKPETLEIAGSIGRILSDEERERIQAITRVSAFKPNELIGAAGNPRSSDHALARKLVDIASRAAREEINNAASEYVNTVESCIKDHGTEDARRRARRILRQKGRERLYKEIGSQDLVSEPLHLYMAGGGSRALEALLNPSIHDPLVSRIPSDENKIGQMQRAVENEVHPAHPSVPLIPPVVLSGVAECHGKIPMDAFVQEVLFRDSGALEELERVHDEAKNQVKRRNPRDSDEAPVVILAACGSLLQLSRHGSGDYVRMYARKVGELIALLAPQALEEDKPRTPDSSLTPPQALRAATVTAKATLGALPPDVARIMAGPILDALGAELAAPISRATKGQSMVDIISGLSGHKEGMRDPDFKAAATLQAGLFLSKIAPALCPDTSGEGYGGILEKSFAENLGKLLAGLPFAENSFHGPITIDCKSSDGDPSYRAVLSRKFLEKEASFIEREGERGVLTRQQAAVTLALEINDVLWKVQKTNVTAFRHAEEIAMQSRAAITQGEDIPQAKSLYEDASENLEELRPQINRVTSTINAVTPRVNQMLRDAGIDGVNVQRNDAGAITQVVITPLNLT